MGLCSTRGKVLPLGSNTPGMECSTGPIRHGGQLFPRSRPSRGRHCREGGAQLGWDLEVNTEFLPPNYISYWPDDNRTSSQWCDWEPDEHGVPWDGQRHLPSVRIPTARGSTTVQSCTRTLWRTLERALWLSCKTRTPSQSVLSSPNFIYANMATGSTLSMDGLQQTWRPAKVLRRRISCTSSRSSRLTSTLIGCANKHFDLGSSISSEHLYGQCELIEYWTRRSQRKIGLFENSVRPARPQCLRDPRSQNTIVPHLCGQGC